MDFKEKFTTGAPPDPMVPGASKVVAAPRGAGKVVTAVPLETATATDGAFPLETALATAFASDYDELDEGTDGVQPRKNLGPRKDSSVLFAILTMASQHILL